MTEEDLKRRQQITLDSASKVLRAGAWLIRNGYGRMSLLPYMAASGCYWRCEFHPPQHPSQAFFRYSSGSAAFYLESHGGETVHAEIRPRELALKIMESVAEIQKDACRGEATQAMLDWLCELDTALDAGLFPSAFDDYSSDDSRWNLIDLIRGNGNTMRPQPGYVTPGSDRGVDDE